MLKDRLRVAVDKSGTVSGLVRTGAGDGKRLQGCLSEPLATADGAVGPLPGAGL